MLKHSILLTLMLGVVVTVFSQTPPPCLSGWNYRTPVTIDNTSNTEQLNDYQVKIEVNTQELIANGKARIDGGDMRFLDKSGVVLSFWVENNTYNTDKTTFWVKIPQIISSTKDTIYFFYGQPTASSIADGEATFELFDDFLDGIIDGAKWKVCNPSNIKVAGGTATFSSIVGVNERATIQSLATVSSPVIVEQYVEQALGGRSFVGLQNDSGDGYAMTYELDGGEIMQLMKLKDDTISCMTLTDQSGVVNAKSVTETQGIWSFSWNTIDIQSFDWPKAVSKETRNYLDYPTI